MQTQSIYDKYADSPPLTIPMELWDTMSVSQQDVYRRAQFLLDVLADQPPVTLFQLLEQSHLPIEQVLLGLKALDAMSLVSIGFDGTQPTIRLVALPDEHVRIVGPDGKARWLFVARPLVEPDVEATRLN